MCECASRSKSERQGSRVRDREGEIHGKRKAGVREKESRIGTSKTTPTSCEDRVLDGPASGGKGSKGRNELDCIRKMREGVTILEFRQRRVRPRQRVWGQARQRERERERDGEKWRERARERERERHLETDTHVIKLRQ